MIWCNVCGKEFPQPYRLRNHVSGVHEGYRPYNCRWEGCNKTFAWWSSLDSHLLSHVRTACKAGTQSFKCRWEACSREFDQSNWKSPCHRSSHNEKEEVNAQQPAAELAGTELGRSGCPSVTNDEPANKPEVEPLDHGQRSSETADPEAAEKMGSPLSTAISDEEPVHPADYDISGDLDAFADDLDAFKQAA